MSASVRLAGYCPMGCGDTLFAANGGYVTCSYISCPEPDAVSTILAEREAEHIVKFDTDGFIIRHPLRERLRNELMECTLNSYISNLLGPPAKPGQYRVYHRPGIGSGWVWVWLGDPS